VVKKILAKLVQGLDLSRSEMEGAIVEVIDGRSTAAQTGGLLTALAAKGESVEELVATVHVLRERCLRVSYPGSLIDTCGTGGDGLGTFNVSTACAFVAAAAGAKVAKHGNRAASGKVGAADVLEALGVRLEVSPQTAVRCLDRCGFAFLFAPAYHPALRRLGPLRRELGFRTLLNLTGPMCNPAGVTRQVVGLFAPQWLVPVAETLRVLGSERVMVVHGADGSDELTPTAASSVVELRDGELSNYQVEPEDFGITRCRIEDLAGGDAAENARLLREVLGGAEGPRSDAVALNAGAALYVADLAPSLGAGIDKARDVLAAGLALGLLEVYARESHAAAAQEDGAPA